MSGRLLDATVLVLNRKAALPLTETRHLMRVTNSSDHRKFPYQKNLLRPLEG